jgi:hypothetical protein
MKRIVCLFMLAIMASASTEADSSKSTQEVEVYICTGPQSKRYHKFLSCKGLKSCSDKVIKVAIQKAKSMGRTPCGYCYK